MHPDPSAALADAMAHHQSGRLVQAAAHYRAILTRDPSHADAIHLLGLATAQSGDAEAGAALIRRAMVLAPAQASHHNSLAFALRQLGRTQEAVLEYRAAATLRPESAEIHNNFAAALTELGCHDEAVAHYRLAAEHAPEVAAIWYNLANALADHDAPAETEACFQRALALDPDYPDALANYGRWLNTRTRWADAEAALTKATRLTPRRPAPWINLAITLSALGHIDAAEACCRTALACDPKSTTAHYNLGCLLLGQGRTAEAADCQAAAISADPSNGAARLAHCISQLPILYETEPEIVACRERYAAALGGLAAATATREATQSLANAIGTSQPFFLPYQGQNDLELQQKYGELACRVLRETQPPATLAAPPGAGTHIRLGIVSGFFCDHTLWKLFLEGWLSQLDRDRFELIAFHTGHTTDACTSQAAAWADRFVAGLTSNQSWRDAIVASAPHILLYPEVGMDPASAWLAAQRLAPVQCVAWGHPETTGMPTIDYFLSSELMEPGDADAHYTERLVRLPNLGMWYRPDAASGDDALYQRFGTSSLGKEKFVSCPGLARAPTSSSITANTGIAGSNAGTARSTTVSPQALPAKAPVYWSGQALYKYLPQYDSIFPRITAAIGPCQFVFIAFARSRAVTESFKSRLRTAFAAMGMNADQYCVFLPPMPQHRFIDAVGQADVLLDTPGWSGGKSTLDCLAHDPAIVTWPGRFMRSRHTAAILRCIGCTETIAVSEDEYVSIAVRLGQDAVWRAAVRDIVRRGKSLAFTDTGYIKALETFLERAIRP